jgi:hypothetical protein
MNNPYQPPTERPDTDPQQKRMVMARIIFLGLVLMSVILALLGSLWRATPAKAPARAVLVPQQPESEARE